MCEFHILAAYGAPLTSVFRAFSSMNISGAINMIKILFAMIINI